MNISMDWYKVFYHVAKEGQISKAAKKLFISQPAVSQSIKLLEDRLGGELFIRTQKGVVLTSEGEELFKFINTAFRYILNGEERFRELKNLDCGEIRIGASDTLCCHYLLDYFKIFHENYPKIKIHVFNKTSYEIIDSLKKGEIDLGFINLPVNIDTTLEIVSVEKLQDCFICGKTYKDAFTKPIHMNQLAKYPLLLLEKGTNMRKFLDHFFESLKITYSPEFELGSIDVLIKFATAGFGISFVTKNFVTKELKNKEVFIVDTIEPIPERAIGMVRLKDRSLSNATKIFYKSFK